MQKEIDNCYVVVSFEMQAPPERKCDMKDFDMIIGYATIKRELEQITDVLKNGATYKNLGVSAPKGLLLYGAPGVGKTLMANCLISASGRNMFACRKNQPDGDFIIAIKDTFSKAVANAPSIIFLDDMDKFANGDEDHRDAEEYVTVQSCIDETKGKDVFVLATANRLRCLPESLLRAGRFDRLIRVQPPLGQDAIRIIEHYLESKKFVTDIDVTFIARVMNGRSCAELETVINEAGLYAGFERADHVTMKHFLTACMRIVFEIQPTLPDGDDCSAGTSSGDNTKNQIVYHEAGHAVISEVLCPNSVTIVSAHGERSGVGGFTSYYYDDDISPLRRKQIQVVSALGGMAAVEQRFGIIDTGTQDDLYQAFDLAKDLISENCMCGFHLHASEYGDSDKLRSKQEFAASCEIERYYRKAKEILALNRDFIERMACQLREKMVLTTFDIQIIKAECPICPVAI